MDICEIYKPSIPSVGFKICSVSCEEVRPCLVKLEIPKTAQCIPTEFSANGDILAFRCDWAKIVDITEFKYEDGVVVALDTDVQKVFNCFYNPSGKTIIYQRGKLAWVRRFDKRNYIATSSGIHCFVNQVAALSYYLGWKGGDE